MFSRQTITKDPVSVTPSVFDIIVLLGWFSYPVAINVTGNEPVLDSTAWHVLQSISLDASNPELLLIPWVAEATGALDGNLADLTDSLLLGDIAINITLAIGSLYEGGTDVAPSWYIRQPYKNEKSFPYNEFEKLEPIIDFKHVDATKNEPNPHVIPWGKFEDVEQRLSGTWNFIPKLDEEKNIPWREFNSKFELNVSQDYSSPDTKDLHKSLNWGKFDDLFCNTMSMGYYYPETKDPEKIVPWNTFNDNADIIFGIDYSSPAFKDVFKTIFIGPNWYPKWCINQFDVSRGGVTFNWITSLNQPYAQYFNVESHVVNTQEKIYPPSQLDKLPVPKDMYSMFPSGGMFAGRALATGDSQLQYRGQTGATLNIKTGYLDHPIYMRNSTEDYPMVCFDGYRTGPIDSLESSEYFPVTTINDQIVEGVYVIMNTVIVTKVAESDGTPVNVDIPVNSVSITGDIDSWAWSLSAEVANKDVFALIKPTAGANPVTVSVSVNGHIWKFYVEGYGKSASFGSSGYTISGRSISAELAQPYASNISHTNSTELTFSAVGKEMLSASGVNAEWSTNFSVGSMWDGGSPISIDYNIKAGHFSLSEKAPIEGLKILSEGLGAILVPSWTTRAITLQPRYICAPWKLDTYSPSVAVNTDFFYDISASWKPAPLYSAIYVAGTTSSGAMARTYRNLGTGDIYMDMKTNQLVTYSEVGAELGRNILSATGRKEEINVSMPVLPDLAAPGIISPGEVIQITDGADVYKVHTMGCSISASIQGSVVTVDQSVTLERHYE